MRTLSIAVPASDDPLSHEPPSDAASDRVRSGPMSVNRVLGVLDTLAQADNALTLTGLAQRVGAPKQSLAGLLAEMCALRYLRRDADGRYLLGVAAHRLASRIAQRPSLATLVHQTLIDLCTELRVTTVFGYLDPVRRSLVYADRCESRSPVRYAVAAGAPLDIHSRSLGKLLLAQLPESDWPTWLGPEPYRATRPTRAPGSPTLPATFARPVPTASAGPPPSSTKASPGWRCRCAAPTAASSPGWRSRACRCASTPRFESILAALREAADNLGGSLRTRGVDAASLRDWL